ncbi:hypothetical protein L6452_02851 [Arctium lappa]|uniref:Uncharacterized protein n=1 Tax=Arctium lappa TaxID=4217 RepID=A0ACB9FK23_ARCLA|nr:hypothetical protein L6452_02851 [Arctium lappa]
MFSTPLQVHQIDVIPNLSTMAHISTLRASVDKAFATMDDLLGRRAIQATTVNTTITTTLDTPPVTLHHEQPSSNPTPPVQHQLVDEPSEETLEPSPITSQNTEPLGTPVNNLSENMAIDSPVDEALPQFSPRTFEHSPSISHVSPVHTATTPPTAGDAQDEDEEVDMTRVKRRTMSKKKLKAKKKNKQTKEVKVAEDTEMEDISSPKRITRQGAQSMAQPEGYNRAVLQKSHSTVGGSKGIASSFPDFDLDLSSPVQYPWELGP